MSEKRPLVAVGVLIEHEGKYLLIKRLKPPSAGHWAVPGGKVEYGERLEDAAKREIKEETGLDIEVGEIIAIVEVFREGFHYVIIDFKGKIIGGNLKPNSDAIEARFFSPSEIQGLKMTPSTEEMLRRLLSGEKPPFFITKIER
ncbi:MAG: NUDIX hydrolase [Sulfolobaceae archaeon]